MQRFHRGRDCDRHDEKRDDLQRLDPIDAQGAAGCEEIQIDQQQRYCRGERTWPWPTVPGGDGNRRYEKQEARRRTISPQREGSNKRDSGDKERQRISGNE